MAICLRRILRKYSSLSYPSLSNQHAFRDQRNPPLYIAPAIEVNHNFWAPRVPATNEPSQPNGNIGRVNATESSEKDAWKNELTLLGNDLYCDKLYLLSLFEKEVFHCAKECKAYKEKETQKEVGSPFDKPDMGQLQRIYHKLREDLPNIFQKSIDHSIYHENLIFENNIRGTKTVGIRNYLKQIAFLRLYVSVKFSSVKFEILKITTHVEDGTIRVRWRIRGVPGFKVIVLFWKQKVWREKQAVEEENDGWFDGFSIFYVKGDGLIHKHVASKLMPNDSESVLRVKHPLAAKVALIIGLISRDFSPPSLKDVNEFVKKESSLSSS